MGYDAYSYVMYGITVNRSKLETKHRVRGCDHDTDTTKKFCSECGEPVWQEETVSILDELEDEHETKLSYFTESGDARNSPNYDFMIGFRLGKTSYKSNRDLVKQPTQQMKQEILAFIQKHKLGLAEKDIQTIVFTYHSY